MSNALGINFHRYINEEGANGWCQVFARLPFDGVELLEKGALFGVVLGENKENWGDVEAELTDWMESFFNKESKEIGLSLFFGDFKEKFPELKAGWLWFVKKEEREVKMVITEGVTLILQRGEQRIDFSGNKIFNKVVSGKVFDQDVYTLGTVEMGIDVEKWEEMTKEVNIARCGMKIEIGLGEPLEEKMETIKEVVTPVMINEPEELVSDRYVGAVGWRERFRNYISERTQKPKNSRTQDSVLLVGGESKKKRWSVVMGIVFLIVLVVSLLTGSIKMRRDGELKKWKVFSEPIEKRLSDSLTLVGINDVGAKKIVEETRQIFDQNKLVFEQSGYKSEVENLNKKIDEVWTKVSGEKNGKTETLLNLDLIRSGVEANRISLVEKNKVLILGQTSGLILSGDVESKEVKVVAGKGVGLGWLDAVSDGAKVMIMTRGGISVVEKESTQVSFDSAVVDPIAMARFGKNVYVLEKMNKEIFRYAATEEGFGERTRWLKEGQVIKSVPVDLSIDVDIWVLGEGGQIERFRRGVREEFAATGLESKVVLNKISVDQNGDKLALLGVESGVVIICNKQTGACNEQIKNERLKQARDIEFDGQNRLLVLFGGSVEVLN